MTKRASLFASSALVFLSLAAPALAQQAQPTQEETQLDEIVVTGSQVTLRPTYPGGQVARGGRVGLFGNLDSIDTPFSITAYTDDLVRDQQARSVADVLQNDPVVRVSKGFGNFQELYVVRGYPVYSDDMTYNGLYGVLPRQYVAAELVQRVEVFHGASAFLNGAAPGGSGVGGAFNLTPKRATDDPLTRLTAGFESGGEAYLAADLGRRFGPDGDWGARLNLAFRDGESTVENQERQLAVVGLGVDWRGDRARFSADLGYQDHHIDAPRPSVTPNGAVPDAPSGETNFAQPWTYTDEQQTFGVVRGEYDLSDSITAWAAFGGRNGEENNVLANPNVNADGSMTAYRFDNARHDQIWSGDIGIRADVWTGPVEHRLVASASQITLTSKNAYAFSSFFTPFSTNLYTPVNQPQPAADFFIGGDLNDPLVTERVRNSSFAIADMATFLDGQLTVTVGARLQDIQTRTYDYNTGVRNGGYDGDAVTPVFAVLYRATDQISLYANYSEALVPGQTAPLVDGGGNPITNPGEVLDPFHGEQAEVGVKYDAGTFGGTVSLFRLTLQSAFIDNGTFAANGEQENSGLEVSVYGEPVEGLRLLGGATWLSAETESGDTAIGVPEFQFNANVEWDVPQVDGLTLEGRVVHTGEQEVNAVNQYQLDSWTRFDAGVRYEFEAGGRPLTLRGRVENLSDENYWAAVGGYPGANYLTLGAPRTFSVSVSAEF